MKHIFLIPIIAVLFSSGASAQTMISAKDASKHIGEKVTICDKVAGEDIKQMGISMLFLGNDRPNQPLSIVISAKLKTKLKGHYKNSAHYEDPYLGKEICVTGVITKGQGGNPIIRVSDPSQIKPFMVDSPVRQPFKN